MTNNTRLLLALVLLLFIFILPTWYIVTNHFQTSAKNKIIESFKLLQTDLKNREENTLQTINTLSTDITLVASLNLIKYYQKTEAYNASIFDQEKKRIIQLLQTNNQNRLSDSIFIYDSKNKLVCFIDNSSTNSLKVINSYKNSQNIYLTKQANKKSYQENKLTAQTEKSIEEASLFLEKNIIDSINIYDYTSKKLSIKSKAKIIRVRPNLEGEIVGSIVMIKHYTQKSMNNLLLEDVVLNCSLEKHPQIVTPKLFSQEFFNELQIKEKNSTLSAGAKLPLKENSLLLEIESR